MSPYVVFIALLSAWASKYEAGYKVDFRWAISAGLITDNGDGILAPNSPITRVEMAVLLLHLVQYVEGIA